MPKSKIIIVVGVYLALAGVTYFFSPSPDASGSPGTRTPFTGFASAWLLASGIGLVLHKKWAYFLYLAGTAMFALLIFVKSMQFGEGFTRAAVGALIPTLVFGLPALLVWIRYDRLLPGKEAHDA